MRSSSVATYRTVMFAACALLMLSFGYRAGFGLFMQPLSQANGWGREVMSLALAVQNLAWGVIAVFAGGLADRFGNLKVLLVGVLLYVTGMAGMAWVTSPLGIILTAGVLVGGGVAGTAFGIVLPAMVRAVPEDKRGWALGVGTAAGSFGQFLVVPIMQQLIEWFEVIPAIKVLAVSAFAMAILAIPLAPYSGASEAPADEVPQSMLRILKKALGSRSYTLLTFGFFVCGFHVAFITVHMPGYVVDLGFAPSVGAWSISLIGLCNVIGAYVAGVKSGRLPRHYILVFIYSARVVAISLFLLLPVSLASILIFSASMGFLWLATVPPTSGLVSVLFGTRYMAFLYGIVFLSHQLGSFIGVWLGGYLYETTGSYNGIWIAGIVLGLVAAVLHWPIQEKDERPLLTAT
ncbi:MFS transporter [Reinekea blandensis]|uniref:MFS permease n=1 Tax=Reinekea blandensis MED297 TaxID=314283 RepID=A4BG29_9GAMM|nr:MFS transporter [Reinekea blandensis]EAR08824.1 MFS permease [Reinekea sp. MED297] [Reinekea blandensis MED297]